MRRLEMAMNQISSYDIWITVDRIRVVWLEHTEHSEIVASGTCPQTPAMQQRHRYADTLGPIPPRIVRRSPQEPKWILHVLG